MSNLKLPLVRTFRLEQWPDGNVYYEQVLTREGAIVDDERTERTVFNSLGPYGHGDQSSVAAFALQAETNAKALLRGQSLAQQDAARVEQANQESEALNVALSGLLKEVTQEDGCSTPQQWWNWWKQHNEVTFPYAEDKPVRRSGAADAVTVTVCSCFVAGTPAITLTGPRPVETIRPGDLVLSQDPRSGELAFQAVLETSVREAAAQRKITFGGSSITATLGHRFWVDGRGWQMTKDLQPGDRLHTPSGAIAIDSIEETDDAPAYGLTVDGFRTYFVGDDQVLVHDKTGYSAPFSAPCPAWLSRIRRRQKRPSSSPQSSNRGLIILAITQSGGDGALALTDRPTSPNPASTNVEGSGVAVVARKLAGAQRPAAFPPRDSARDRLLPALYWAATRLMMPLPEYGATVGLPLSPNHWTPPPTSAPIR